MRTFLAAIILGFTLLTSGCAATAPTPTASDERTATPTLPSASNGSTWGQSSTAPPVTMPDRSVNATAIWVRCNPDGKAEVQIDVRIKAVTRIKVTVSVVGAYTTTATTGTYDVPVSAESWSTEWLAMNGPRLADMTIRDNYDIVGEIEVLGDGVAHGSSYDMIHGEMTSSSCRLY